MCYYYIAGKAGVFQTRGASIKRVICKSMIVYIWGKITEICMPSVNF
jgi:hypothetical protein